MTLVRRLAEHALERHPARSATVIERRDEEETIRLLEGASVASATEIIQHLSPHYVTSVLQGMNPDRAAQLVGGLPVDSATRLVRRLDGTCQMAILERLELDRRSNIRSVLRFPPGSAGALMDPEVLALPQELTAREALQRVRKSADLARYNLYVVGHDQRLVGALNLRELLRAPGRDTLADLMTRDPHRLSAMADRASLITHPGWKEVHSLPVVDDAGAYLGAVRYKTLRGIEEEFMSSRREDAEAGAAFGQIITAGARGLLDAISGAAPVRAREEKW